MRPVLGAAVNLSNPGAYTQALVDINTMALDIQEGDNYAKGPTPSYDSAVQAYKKAGNLGAITLGPEIDNSGAPNTTQIYTQQAWVLNTTLAILPDTGNTQATQQAARGLANGMLSYYQQAVAAGQNAQAPTPGPLAGNQDAVGTIITLSVIGGLLFAGWKLSQGAPRRRRAYA